MSIVAHSKPISHPSAQPRPPSLWPDEAPTRPALPTTGRMMVLAARIDRLVEIAIERLEADPDADSILAAITDLTRIKDLCLEASR